MEPLKYLVFVVLHLFLQCFNALKNKCQSPSTCSFHFPLWSCSRPPVELLLASLIPPAVSLVRGPLGLTLRCLPSSMQSCLLIKGHSAVRRLGWQEGPAWGGAEGWRGAPATPGGTPSRRTSPSQAGPPGRRSGPPLPHCLLQAIYSWAGKTKTLPKRSNLKGTLYKLRTFLVNLFKVYLS